MHMKVGDMLVDTWMTPHEQQGGMFCFFSVVLLTSEEEVTLAETLFTPETPEVQCGLKHFTHPSIRIVVSR